jgi:uncharacterized protein
MNNLIQIQFPSGTSAAAEQKEHQLLRSLRGLPSVVVALSGGTDSAYLAWAAHQALRNKALCVTAISPSYSSHDREVVESFVADIGVRHQFIETREMDNPAYRANASSRCYFCKDELFSALDELAGQLEFAAVAYGINADDTLDFRPGHRAATEHHVLAPLLDANLTKAEIRALSHKAGLPTWDRPASACLASRIPYGTEVTPERLSLVERGEAALRTLGFLQFRVRLHDSLARVEISPEEMPRAMTPEMASLITSRLKEVGFTYVALDLTGYRQGSLNEGIPGAARQSAKARTGT